MQDTYCVVGFPKLPIPTALHQRNLGKHWGLRRLSSVARGVVCLGPHFVQTASSPRDECHWQLAQAEAEAGCAAALISSIPTYIFLLTTKGPRTEQADLTALSVSVRNVSRSRENYKRAQSQHQAAGLEPSKLQDRTRTMGAFARALHEEAHDAAKRVISTIDIEDSHTPPPNNSIRDGLS